MAVPWIYGQPEGPRPAQKWLPSVDGGAELTVTLKQWNGSAWVEYTAVPRVWSGTEWMVKRPKRFDGTGWVGLP